MEGEQMADHDGGEEHRQYQHPAHADHTDHQPAEDGGDEKGHAVRRADQAVSVVSFRLRHQQRHQRREGDRADILDESTEGRRPAEADPSSPNRLTADDEARVFPPSV
jgi:hypothetical protein